MGHPHARQYIIDPIYRVYSCSYLLLRHSPGGEAAGEHDGAHIILLQPFCQSDPVYGRTINARMISDHTGSTGRLPGSGLNEQP
jgi:hypothetical protein